MKRKIALLLTFAMLLTVLPIRPLDVFASEGSLAGQPTGALWERTLGRATNVRHWNPGVLVARPSNLQVFRTSGITPNNSSNWDNKSGSSNMNDVVIADASGNLRNILASMEYFNSTAHDGQYAASITMQLHNAQGYMRSLFNGAPAPNGYGFDDYGFNFYDPPGETSSGFYGGANGIGQGFNPNPSVTTTPAPGFTYSTGTSGQTWEQFVRFMVERAIIDRLGPSPDDQVPQPAMARYTSPGGVGVARELYLSGANALSVNQIRDVFRGWTATRTTLDPSLDNIDSILNAYARALAADGTAMLQPAQIETIKINLFELLRQLRNVNFVTGIDVSNPTLVAIERATDIPDTMVLAFVADVIGAYPNPNYDSIPTGSNPFSGVFARAFDLRGMLKVLEPVGGLPDQLINVFTQDETANTTPRTPLMMFYQEDRQAIETLSDRDDFMVAILPRYTTTSTGAYSQGNMLRDQVDLVLIRSTLSRSLVTGQYIPRLSVPIEYVTDNRTNDNPVYVSYVHRHQWPQAGESNSITYLTNNTDSRFTLGLYEDGTNDVATPRTFHRYGRGLIPGIRISEAVQSAFDRSDWWVEIELLTQGFYWTEGSQYGRSGNTNTRFDDRFRTRFQTSQQNGQTNANDLRPVRTVQNVMRTPATGNNRFNVLSFPVTFEGVNSNLQRQVNDWLQIEDLQIGATDRARNGDVEAEVRLYRRGETVTASGTVSSGNWSWHPYPLNTSQTIGSTTYNTGDLGREVFPLGPDLNLYPSSNPSSITDNRTVRYLTRGRQIVDSIGSATSGNDQVVGEFRWNQPIQGGTTTWGPAGDSVFDDKLVVARFGTIGLELFVHEDDSVEDHQLRSGARDWEFIRTPPPGETRPTGAVIEKESDFAEHTTVRAVLRETAPGSLPATGAHPTVYTFGEGIQLLGVRLWANEANFSAGHDDDDAKVFFGDNRTEADSFLNATIERNSVTIRPEIGEGANRRWRMAEVWAEFYISIQPGYEKLYGENIDLTVTSGTVDLPFEGTLTVAYAWDPITVDTTNIVIDENDNEAAFGVIRGIDVSDIVITETRSGALSAGQRIWLGIEGGISRGWGSGDHAALRAASVEATGNLAVTPIQHDSHGVFVEVTRSSNVDGAQLIFSGVQVTGRVVPDHQYNVIVADTGAAHNWEGWSWINSIQSDVGFTRGLVRGFFNEEPYVTPAFRFEGEAEIYAPIEVPGGGTNTGPGTGNGQGTVTPPLSFAPVILTEGMSGFNSVRAPGTMISGTPLLIESNPLAPGFATSYVMLTVIADLLGIEGVWDAAARTGTFSDGRNTLVVTEGSTTATFNGQPRQITASGLPAQSIIRNDRFYVPVAFFREIPEWAISVIWEDRSAFGGSRTVTVQPRVTN